MVSWVSCLKLHYYLTTCPYSQNVIIMEEEEKFHKLMEILGHFGEGQSLIFVHTQQKCDLILKDLMLASYSVMSLHGGRCTPINSLKSVFLNLKQYVNAESLLRNLEI